MSIATSILSLVPPLRHRINRDDINRTEGPTLSHLHDVVRQQALAARLDAECAQITALHRAPATYGFDQAVGWWVQVENWTLPAGMNHEATSLILMLPPEYPAMAPSSLLVPRDLGGAQGWLVRELLPASEANSPSIIVDDQWSRCAVPLARWNELDDLDRVLAALSVVLDAALRLRLITVPIVDKRTHSDTGIAEPDNEADQTTRLLPSDN